MRFRKLNKFEYTEHAEFRMRHRAISKTDTEDTVRNPDLSFTTRFGRSVALKKFGGKFLKVVYEKSNDKIIVVTVYWMRRLRRQW